MSGMDEKTLLECIKRCDFTSCNQKEIREIAVGIIEEIENIKKTLMSFQLRTDEVAQFTGEIIEIFEDFLERKQIVIVNDEKDEAITDGEDPACIGNIYGTDYGELQSDIEETLLRWRLVKEEK